MPSVWWLRVLYAIPLVALLSLVTLVIGEVVYAFESEGHEHEEHEHGFYETIFDAAWFVFLPSAVATLATGAGALLVGGLRRNGTLVRYGGWALGSFLLAALVLVVVDAFA